MKEWNYKTGTIYQFLVLIAIITFIGWGFYKTSEWNEILVGALLGVMISMPFSIKEPQKESDKDE